jgi:lysophospholipase L1-like esterase
MRFAIIVLVFISVLAFGKSVVVNANNENISIIGRADFKAQYPTFSHAGIQIKFNFKGESLAVGLSDITDGFEEHLNYYNIYINDTLVSVLEIKPLGKWYDIDYSFNNRTVEVMIFKRTEAMCAGGVFEGLKVDEGAIISKSKAKTKKIEWIGDSFTAGYGNMISNAAPPKGNPNTGFHAINEDNSKAWGALASKTLNAEYMCTAFSGLGIYRNYDNSEDTTILNIYEQVTPGVLNVKWNFSLYQPDLVVVNVGQNDFGPETYAPVVMTDSLRFSTAYLALLKQVKSHNPKAKILIAIGGGLSDFYPKGFKRLTRSRAWLKTIANTFNESYPNSCSTFELKTISPPYGEDWHPTLNSHKLMAGQAVVAIKNVMNW